MTTATPELESAFYTKAEVCQILKRSASSVERLMKKGLLKRDPTFGRVVFSKRNVDAFVNRASAN